MSSPVNHNDDTNGLAAASTGATAPNGDQKRTCTNDAPDEPEGKKRRVAEAGEDAKPPAAERCYICFDFRDGDGELPVRDCSCRGGAGFAHKSCIVQYAKMNHDNRGLDFIGMWKRCPQCKQRYQNDLAVDLANEAVSFVEGRAPTASRARHLLEQILALNQKQFVVKGRVREVESTAKKVLSVIDEVKKLANASLFDAVTKSAGASACLSLANVALAGDSAEEAEEALEYFEKARLIYEELGEEQSVVVVDTAVASIKKMIAGSRNLMSKENFKNIERLYEEAKTKKGGDDADVIQTGLSLAGMYLYTNKMKAERLLVNLVGTCRRVHGANHGISRQAMSELQSSKERRILVPSRSGAIEFHALRYEEGGEKCIVQGPIEEPRNVDGEGKRTVAANHVFILKGTPVICHCAGYMTRAKREIDGKLGVVGVWDNKRDCYEVCFEDEDLGTRWVKRESVRILFELPSEETDP